MRSSKLAFRLSVGAISPMFLIAAASASDAGNDRAKYSTRPGHSKKKLNEGSNPR
jgi:hypothetical protein